MGGSTWNPSYWDTYKTTKIKDKKDHEIFTSRGMPKGMDPKTIPFRESRDSAANPNSTPIIIAFDVTGSMGHIPKAMVREGIKTTIEEIIARKPVSDPHIMVMGVGDAEAHDIAPLQVSQFEADIKIVEQLSDIYLEGGGGGNDHESYNLPWYFAATKTKIDCYEKRGKKGILFTIGDEEPAIVLHKDSLKRVMGEKAQADLPSLAVLELVQQKYDVFHIVVEEGSYARATGVDRVADKWSQLIGKDHVIRLADHTKLPEVIVSALQVNAGENAADVTKSWDGKTGLVVQKAINGLAKSQNNANRGVVRFA